MSERRKGEEMRFDQKPTVEKEDNKVEMGAEHIPNKEEVGIVLADILGDEEYVEGRIQSDEQGLYLWEIEIPGEKPGETIEYSYRRGTNGPASEGKLNKIHIAYYDEDGMPEGGKTAAVCKEGVWRILT